MRAYIKNNRLHVVTQEYEKLVGLDGETEIPGKKIVFDEAWTEVARKAFKEYEDAPEERLDDFWFIDEYGNIVFHSDGGYIDSYRIIGNYFQTKEEAEEAVEKLKAFKRLKDAGFKFIRAYMGGKPCIYFNLDTGSNLARIDQIKKDFHLIFGEAE